MPRPAQGAKLWFDKARGTYTISDGKFKRRTGFSRSDVKAAEAELAEYIAGKHTVNSSNADPLIVDMLSVYFDEVTVGSLTEDAVTRILKHLRAWWGDKTLKEITVANCKAYFIARGSKIATCRAELAFLTALINHLHKHHNPIIRPVLWMPERPANRIRWLTRSEAAAFLWKARHTPQLARLFVVGWYTGSRRAVILALRWQQVDFEAKILHRKPPGSRQTKKRAPPVRMGRRLMSHLARWKRLDADSGSDLIIHHYTRKGRDKPLRGVDTTWHKARKAANLSADVTPHVLRHSRATHQLRQGVNPYEAAQSLGMSLKQLETTYGHFIPDWQANAAEAK